MTVAVDAPLRLTVAAEPADDGLIVPEILQVGEPPELRGRTSQMLRLNRSVVGAVSLMVTVVPLTSSRSALYLNPVGVARRTSGPDELRFD